MENNPLFNSDNFLAQNPFWFLTRDEVQHLALFFERVGERLQLDKDVHGPEIESFKILDYWVKNRMAKGYGGPAVSRFFTFSTEELEVLHSALNAFVIDIPDSLRGGSKVDMLYQFLNDLATIYKQRAEIDGITPRMHVKKREIRVGYKLSDLVVTPAELVTLQTAVKERLSSLFLDDYSSEMLEESELLIDILRNIEKALNHFNELKGE